MPKRASIFVYCVLCLLSLDYFISVCILHRGYFENLATFGSSIFQINSPCLNFIFRISVTMNFEHVKYHLPDGKKYL